MGDIFGAIGSALLEFVLPTLATAIGGLVVGLLTRQLKKVKIELTVEQEERLRQLVKDAVLAVEEMARRNPELKGDDKEKIAARIVMEKMPDVPATQLRDAIDAALPEIRRQLAPVPSTPATFGRPPAQ